MGQDRPMNDFAPVQDAEYVYVELADGSQGKMKKSDLANIIKGLIPTFGYTTCYPEYTRWKRILNMDIPGECFLSFLYSGGSYTNAESCCFIVNIMKGAQKEVVAKKISGNGIIGQVYFHYKFDGDNLKIWVFGSYTALGGALINLSSINLPFEMVKEDPPSDSIKA